MRTAVAALACTLASSTGAAQEISVKDFVLGADLRTEAAKANMNCSASPVKGSTAEWCRPGYPIEKQHESLRTIATVPTKHVFFFGRGGKLGSISWSFDQSDFGTVRAAYAEKYPGMRCQDSTVQNRMGATFDQVVCRFETPTAKLEIRRRGADLTEGRLSAFTRTHEAEQEAEEQRRAQEAKKDI